MPEYMRAHIKDSCPPPDHISDAPIVVPLGVMDSKRWTRSPFAAIIALDPGENVSVKPRTCINVWVSEGSWFFGDGIFACESSCPMILGTVGFPELTKAIRMPRREWSPLLKVPKGFKPYTQLKNWQQGEMEVTHYAKGKVVNSMPDQQFGPTIAFNVLSQWNAMEKVDWRERLVRTVTGTESLGVNLIGSMINRLQRLCYDIGLETGHQPELKAKFNDLFRSIALAELVYLRELGATKDVK